MHMDDFERLYHEHAESLFSFIAYRTGDRSRAEDLMAETFTRAIKARRGFDRRRASEKTWLYSIALNLIRDDARRRGSESRAFERAPESVTVPPGSETHRWLDEIEDRDFVSRALGRLEEPEREAISLRYGADLTVPEIAKLLGEPLTTVEGRVYRALRKLRDELS
jgi:RNA polymerase sigma-70 factor (ECF subfamily)